MQIGCCYIPEFPAWVLGRRILQDTPLIVAASGRVASASPELRRLGIEIGMPAGRAEELAPEARVVLRDGPYEEAVWEEVLALLYEHTPFIEPLAPGEALFRTNGVAEVRTLAERLGVQMGAAAERPTARLAARRSGRGSLLAISSEHREAFLQRYELSALTSLGFEEDFLERLRLFGYRTLGEASALSLKHLHDQFGEEGEALHARLHPVEERRITTYQPPPTLTERYGVEHPAAGAENLAAALKHVVGRLAEQLGCLRCQRLKVMVAVEGHGGVLFSCRILPEPAARPATLFRAAERLLRELLHPEARVHTLAVELGTLSEPAPQQATLFEERPQVERAIEAVHRRYPGTIRRPVITEHVLFPEEAAALEAFG